MVGKEIEMLKQALQCVSSTEVTEYASYRFVNLKHLTSLVFPQAASQ